MIKSVQIRGYRGFSEFEMSNLSRVNLLVGTNNSGKTSVLEGIHLLTSRGDPYSLWQILWRRGERLAVVERNPDRQTELDVSNLFNGHDAVLNSKFSISAKNESPERKVTFSVGEIKAEPAAAQNRSPGGVPSRLGLHITEHPRHLFLKFTLADQGG